MVQLQILSGKKAGTQWSARRFPVRVGRSAVNQLPLEDDGIWDEHFQLTLDRAEGFVLTACPDALVTVNRQPVQSARLRNGDSIEAGAVRMQFWLGETRQRGLRLREWFIWSLIVAICFGEISAIYWLIK